MSCVPVSCLWRHLLLCSWRVSTLICQNQASVMWSRENTTVLKKKKSAPFNKKELQHWWSETGMSSMTCCGLSCRDVAFCGRQQCPEPISWRWETNPHLNYWQFVKGTMCLVWYLHWDAQLRLSFSREGHRYPCNKNEGCAPILGSGECVHFKIFNISLTGSVCVMNLVSDG